MVSDCSDHDDPDFEPFDQADESDVDNSTDKLHYYQYRTSRTGNRQTRTTQIDHDVFEGLPVRHWRKKPVNVSNVPERDMPSAVMPNGYKELPLPRDFHLLPENSQVLLRAARMGLLKRKEIIEEDKDNEDTERVESNGDSGFVANKWTLVPRELEDSEPEYLAKRRKGLPSAYTGGTAPVISTGHMRKTRVRKVDGEGNTSILEVLVPHGQTVDGEIIEEETSPVQPLAPGTVVEGVGVANAEGLIVAGEQAAPVQVRRRPPIPKKKKKHGPGRGRKKLVTSVPAQQRQTVAGEGLVEDGVSNGGQTLPSTKLEDGENMDGEDSFMRDAHPDEEEGSEEGSEMDEGDEGDREEGEVSPSPSVIPPSVPENLIVEGPLPNAEEPPPPELPRSPSKHSPIPAKSVPPPDAPVPLPAAEHSPTSAASVRPVDDASSGLEVEKQLQVPHATVEGKEDAEIPATANILDRPDEEMLDEAIPASEDANQVLELSSTKLSAPDIPPTDSPATEPLTSARTAVEAAPTGRPSNELSTTEQPTSDPPSIEQPISEPSAMEAATTEPPAMEPLIQGPQAQEPLTQEAPIQEQSTQVPSVSEPTATESSTAAMPQVVSPTIPTVVMPDPTELSESPAAREPPPIQIGEPLVTQEEGSDDIPKSSNSPSILPSSAVPMGPPVLDVQSQQILPAAKDQEARHHPLPQSLPNIKSPPPIPQTLAKFPEPPANPPPPPQRPPTPPPQRRPPPPPSLPSDRSRRPSGSTPEAPTPSPPTPIETTFDPTLQNLSPRAPTMSPPTPIAHDMDSSPETALASRKQPLPEPPPLSLDPPTYQPRAPIFIPGLQMAAPEAEERVSVQAAPLVPRPHSDAEIPHEHDPLDGLAAPKMPPDDRKLVAADASNSANPSDPSPMDFRQRQSPIQPENGGVNAEAAPRVDNPTMNAEIPHQHDPLDGLQAPEMPPAERRLGGEAEEDLEGGGDLLGNLERSLES